MSRGKSLRVMRRRERLHRLFTHRVMEDHDYENCFCGGNLGVWFKDYHRCRCHKRKAGAPRVSVGICRIGSRDRIYGLRRAAVEFRKQVVSRGCIDEPDWVKAGH
jgi:hypothetical protein